MIDEGLLFSRIYWDSRNPSSVVKRFKNSYPAGWTNSTAAPVSAGIWDAFQDSDYKYNEAELLTVKYHLLNNLTPGKSDNTLTYVAKSFTERYIAYRLRNIAQFNLSDNIDSMYVTDSVGGNITYQEIVENILTKDGSTMIQSTEMDNLKLAAKILKDNADKAMSAALDSRMFGGSI